MILVFGVAQSQTVYQTKSGMAKFYSAAPAENIEAINNLVDSKLATNGQVVFLIPIRGFVFKNALMQEHFNENYMESSKFPKAVFMGTISNLKDVEFTKDGSYNVTVSGDITIHGVKKNLSTQGTIEIKGGKVSSKSTFKINITDFGIKGNYIGEKIAKQVDVTIDCKYN
jgi:polyisoprenoid-binding protein YceI